jgi:hypothetical protein
VEGCAAEVIDFLERFKILALSLVLLSVPVFVFFSVGAVVFCDTPRTSTCFGWIGAISAVLAVQVLCLSTAWLLLKKRRYIYLCASLMLLSVLPAFYGLFIIFR